MSGEVIDLLDSDSDDDQERSTVLLNTSRRQSDGTATEPISLDDDDSDSDIALPPPSGIKKRKSTGSSSKLAATVAIKQSPPRSHQASSSAKQQSPALANWKLQSMKQEQQSINQSPFAQKQSPARANGKHQAIKQSPSRGHMQSVKPSSSSAAAPICMVDSSDDEADMIRTKQRQAREREGDRKPAAKPKENQNPQFMNASRGVASSKGQSMKPKDRSSPRKNSTVDLTRTPPPAAARKPSESDDDRRASGRMDDPIEMIDSDDSDDDGLETIPHAHNAAMHTSRASQLFGFSPLRKKPVGPQGIRDRKPVNPSAQQGHQRIVKQEPAARTEFKLRKGQRKLDGDYELKPLGRKHARVDPQRVAKDESESFAPKSLSPIRRKLDEKPASRPVCTSDSEGASTCTGGTGKHNDEDSQYAPGWSLDASYDEDESSDVVSSSDSRPSLDSMETSEVQAGPMKLPCSKTACPSKNEESLPTATKDAGNSNQEGVSRSMHEPLDTKKPANLPQPPLKDADQKPLTVDAECKITASEKRSGSVTAPSRKRPQTSVSDTSHLDSYEHLLPKRERRRSSETIAEEHVAETEVVEEVESFLNMLFVPHLTWKETDSNGLPRHWFTAYRNSGDSILYDFEVRIKASRVAKNAGYGAFLVYRGARVLKKDMEKKTKKKLRERDIIDPGTFDELEATRQDGSGLLISLTGKNLHGPNNSIFRAHTEKPLKAQVGRYQKKVSVKLVGDNLHYDSDEEPMDLSCCSKRIGRLGLHIESDYCHSSSVEFVAGKDNVAVFDLGRYAPSRKEDRKRKVDYDTKNFIFDQEPSGWCYGIDERRLGCEQIIDITDDTTGELHEDAKQQTTIYVNEVGHNPTLVKNVEICTIGDNIVKYYAKIDHNMAKGDEVELLVDYKGVYESIRERKGYGAANLRGKTKSDGDMATKLQRNFEERQAIVQMVETLEPLELYYNLEFLVSRIVPTISGLADVCYTPTPTTPRPTPRQLIARRRLHWLYSLYVKRIDAIEGFGFRYETDDNVMKSASKYSDFGQPVVEKMREKCKLWSEDLCWNVLKSTTPLPNVSDKQLSAVLDDETVEEVLFWIRDHVERPMDVNIWCPIARNLMSALCKVAFNQERSGSKIYPETLATDFIDCATKAAGSIQRAIASKSFGDLSFLSGSEGSVSVRGTPENMAVLEAGTALSNSFVPKGITSALLDLQAYNDIVGLGLESQLDTSELERTCNDPVVIVKSALGQSCCDGIPRRVNFVKNMKCDISDRWYLVWQNIYLVNQLYMALLRKARILAEGEACGFLKRLCRALHVDITEARIAVDTGIRTDLPLPLTSFVSPVACAPQSKRRSKKKSRKGTKAVPFKMARKAKKPKKSGAPRAKPIRMTKKLFDGIIWKALEGLGWTVVYGNRPTDSYYLPPGVQRGPGFKSRIDFFDSTTQILNCLSTYPQWKDKEEVKNCLKLYHGCVAFLSKNKLKGELKIDWLIEQIGH